MLNKLSFLFYFLSLVSFGQEKDMVYQIVYDIDRDDFGMGITTFTNELLVDNNAYRYTRKNIRSTTSEIHHDIAGYYNYHIGEIGSNIDYNLTIDKKGKEYNVKDDLPKINWKIDQDKNKKIGDHLCGLAIGNYRGRVVYAYFTTEIPITVGPHNLNGLPGAIIYAYTHDKAFEIKALSIKKVKRPDYFIVFDTYDDFGDVISKKEYISIEDKEKKEFDELLRIRYEGFASDQTGVKTDVETVSEARSTLELFYEWELEDEK